MIAMNGNPVPTCWKLHAHNYTSIPIFLGRRGTPDPTGQFVLLLFYYIGSKNDSRCCAVNYTRGSCQKPRLLIAPNLMYYRKPSNNFVDSLRFYSPNKFSLLTRADTQFRIFQPKIPQTFYLGL